MMKRMVDYPRLYDSAKLGSGRWQRVDVDCARRRFKACCGVSDGRARCELGTRLYVRRG